MFVVYGLKDPRDGQIRYIGRTVDLERRIEEHGRRPHWNVGLRRWLEELDERGLSPSAIVLAECGDDWQALSEAERGAILEHRRAGAALLNICDGGASRSRTKGLHESPERWRSVMDRLGYLRSEVVDLMMEAQHLTRLSSPCMTLLVKIRTMLFRVEDELETRYLELFGRSD